MLYIYMLCSYGCYGCYCYCCFEYINICIIRY